MQIHFRHWSYKDEKGFGYELFLSWYVINFPNSSQVPSSDFNKNRSNSFEEQKQWTIPKKNHIIATQAYGLFSNFSQPNFELISINHKCEMALPNWHYRKEKKTNNNKG